MSRPDGALLTYRDGALKVAVPASARAGADVIEDGAGRVLVWQRRAFQLWVWRNERLEPWRLARELHDTLLQGFTGIVLQLEGLRHLLRHSHGPSAEQMSRILTLADSRCSMPGSPCGTCGRSRSRTEAWPRPFRKRRWA